MRRFLAIDDHTEKELMAGDMSVVVGAHKIKDLKEPTQRRHQVRRAVIHKLYPTHKYRYDIMLLQLKQRIKYNENVRPICVDNTRFPADTKSCVVTGWGAKSATSKL